MGTANRGSAATTAILVILVGACSAPNDAPRAVEQMGDTLLIRSSVAVAADTADLRRIARVGLVDGPPDEMLGDVSAFARGPNGRIIVADDAGLRAFASDGRFLQWIARPGEGPGEVGYVAGLDISRDGRIFVVDLGNRRINVYDESGASSDHWPMPDGMPGYGRGAITAADDGLVYVATNPTLPLDGQAMSYPRPVFVALGADGATKDTLFAPERYAERCPTRSSAHWRAGFYEDLRVTYLPKVKWAISPAGTLAFGCPASFEIDLVESGGSVVRTVLEDYARVDVPSSEREATVDLQTWSRRRNGYSGENWCWEGALPAAQKPAYQRLIFGREGGLWVRPAQPSDARELPEELRSSGLPRYAWDEGTGGAFEVFTETAEYRGAVRLPPGVSYDVFPGSADPYIRGDTVLMLARDDLDVLFVDLYEVIWPAGGRSP